MAYEGGRAIAFGADALEYAGVDGVFLAKWFKLQYVHWTCMTQPSLTAQLTSFSLHPDSMKVSNEPPSEHIHSPVAKLSNKSYILPKHSRYRSEFRDPAATCHGVVEEDIRRHARVPL